MTPDESIGALVALGFTELEAEVYTFLLQESPATGYRVAQAIGKPAANTYKAIETLQNKGAVIVERGASRLCRAIPAEELLGQLERSFQERKQRAETALAELDRAPEDERVYQLQSWDQVLGRCRTMLKRCQRMALLDIFPQPLDALRADIEEAAARGVDVILKAFTPVKLAGVDVTVNPRGESVMQCYPGQWIILITDGKEMLLAFLTPDGRGVHQAVWSGSAYLSWIFHSACSAELMLGILLHAMKEKATASEMQDAIQPFFRLMGRDIPGYRELLHRFGAPDAITTREETAVHEGVTGSLKSRKPYHDGGETVVRKIV
ncbi:MAG TPA: helix-turn-helix domain-containing protein [Chthonomonadaceae bacterium]|nr:helix-turn-helix domain-containing protein [Chthonomonadaceae bacterium]